VGAVPRVVPLALALAAFAAGCGGPEAGSKPGDTVRSYLDALSGGDYAGACSLISKDAVKKIESASNRSCKDAVQAGVEAAGGPDKFKGGTFTDPQVRGDQATTTLKFSGGVTAPEELVREGGRWKIQTPGNGGGG
jgi:hypothetical protein